MPCWPDVWDYVKGILPILGVGTVFLLYVALVVLLLWAPRVQKGSLRIASRILGAVLGIGFVVALPAILFGAALAFDNPPAKVRVVQSPSGEQAKLSYKAGFLGRDRTEVIVKTNNCCRHILAFWHAGPTFFDDIKVEWVNDHHLHLTYHVRPDDPQHCERQVGGIELSCTSIPWPTPKAPSDLSSSQQR
jgi:hypothetical protein